MALEAGQRVGDYEVLGLLGAGGMGRVYKVRNIISDRVEAMKVLLPDFAAEPELAARFMAEIRTLGGLDHPNIAQLRTAFQFENQLVMIMEFVEGTTLEKLGSQSRLPVSDVIEYALQALSALSYAHGRGVTHRDIKPANIMITSHGLVKLMDFGIAKSSNDLHLTRPGTTMGSVYYISPEQVRGGIADPRSDIYSFGVTLYELLAGRRPFQADTAYSVLNAQLNETPPPLFQVNPDLPQELSGIVLHAMAKSPADRFQTAEDFRAALKSLREPQPARAAATAPAPSPSPSWSAISTTGMPSPESPTAVPPVIRSHRGLWIGLGAATAILAIVLAATIGPRLSGFAKNSKPTAPQADNSSVTPSAAPDTAPSAGTSGNAAAPATAISPLANTPLTPSPTTAPRETTAAHSTALSSGSGSNLPAKSSSPQQPDRVANPAPSSVTPPPGPSPSEVSAARTRLVQLRARAETARNGIQQIRSQQQAQGFDMRGDVLASMNRMNTWINEANLAMQQNDIDSANQNMDHAEKELTTLEAFLGQ
ncbi:serine/threonine protein kinase [Paracidobacterium acidisoli]|uniref:non-specific serine/threonine protein kinase n=1 Tax=Paracidobacterium acidisoli TaxID=2303751 RepID=A0A372IQY2_9BACT|nr:serine/threonine-protein kinase [Paracidobacterium acidisoli]MBT9330191.1 protein kinase [Paracidobacterium acidisoli]